MPLLRRFAVLLVFASCSFSPNLDGATCGVNGLCPAGYLCGPDGKCHQGVQNSVDGPPMHDGPPMVDASPDAPVLCGNGRLDPGEVCDPGIPSDTMGHCPTQTECNTGNACSTDTITGSAAACTATCTHTPITTCGPNDGCCPAGQGCNHNLDTDCSASCGNGVVEAGETCDKGIAAGMAGACPMLADCDDGDACTGDAIVGSADTCTAQCLHQTISVCGPREGCCPSTCNANTDPDCSPVCGNNVLESGETCDPPSSCPQDITACNDSNTCTVDTYAGSASNCTAQCVHTPIMVCTSGDGCCAPGCNSNIDNDCSPVCGNNVVEAGETCDPPARCPASVTDCNDNNSCTVDTYTGSAGNCTGLCHHQLITTCSGSTNDGCCPSGCNSVTDRDCNAVCGNGILEGGELCDTGITSGPGKCPTVADCNDNNPCTADTVQGTGCQQHCVHTQDTSCSLSGNSCCPPGCNANNDVDCSPQCGNGVVESGEFCDTAIGAGLPGHCPSQSTDCDDGDPCTVDDVTGTGCQTHCTHVAASCSFANDNCCPTGCNANNDIDCQPMCGNGIIEPGETCDTGIPGNCPTSCPPPSQMCASSQLINPGTCQAQCVTNNSAACSPAGQDMCCAYGCSNFNDSDCPSSWTFSLIAPNYSFTPSPACHNLTVSLTAGHYYVITTCTPPGQPLPTGDTMINVTGPSGQAIGFDDDCNGFGGPNPLPIAAGWSCNIVSSSGPQFASCVGTGPSGFLAPQTGVYTICLEGCCGASGTANIYLWQN